MKNNTFSSLGLSENTLQALQKKGFEEPSPIQAAIIPLLLQGENDVIGQAQTGTGKTAAFALPLIDRLEAKGKQVQALILTPTRELALQIVSEVNSLKGEKKLQVAAIYGGQSMSEQLRRLKQGVDIIVGTPGRVLDHLRRKSLSLDHLSYVVLDEADEMLNMGFIEDVEEILNQTNQEKRILMFSATMPKHLLAVTDKFMTDKKIISVKNEQLTTNLTDQIYFQVNERDKFDALCRIIDVEPDFFGVVFAKTKIDCEQIASQLIDRGYSAGALHGDIDQKKRERILGEFRKQKINILVATDVAARGIDINNLTHVINYAIPHNPEAYIHRIGRTGRAGKQGTAITFITSSEFHRLSFIKRITKTEIRREKLPRVEDILKIKKARIQTEIENSMDDNLEDYEQLAHVLLKKHDPHLVLSAVLKCAFQDDLSEKNYSDIDDREINHTGKTRLFIARGKRSGMTPRKVISFIQNTAPMNDKKIRDIQIFDDFCFVSVPFNDAEIIIQKSKARQTGEKPMIEKAKEN